MTTALVISLACLAAVFLVVAGVALVAAITRDVLLTRWKEQKASTVADMEKVVLTHEKRIQSLESGLSNVAHTRFGSKR